MHPLLIIVPRTRADQYRSLCHSFGDGAEPRVILDRRITDRRVRIEVHGAERRRADRRLESGAQTALSAGRWIAVARAARPIDFGDPDRRAILFLCCSEHLVPCQECQDTYRLGWIPRTAPGVFHCPRCGHDLAPLILAHAQTCQYWRGRS